MSGLGLGPFGATPLGIPAAALPAEDVTTLSTSRSIDPSTGRYVINDEGGFDGMNDSMQRVLLLISFEMGEESAFIDDTYAEDTKARIRSALAPMTDPAEPAITIQDIRIEHHAPGATRRIVKFTDLVTNTTQTAIASL